MNNTNSGYLGSGSLIAMLLLAITFGGITGLIGSPQADAQMAPILSPDSDCGQSTAVDAAAAGSGNTWIAYDCSSTSDVRIVRITGDASDHDSPQTVAQGYPADVSIVASSDGSAFGLAATKETGHLESISCTSGGTCTTSSEHPDAPTPPDTIQEITLASGVDTSEATCDEVSCTLDNANLFDFCNDGCDDPARVVNPAQPQWNTISGTQWISGSQDGTGFSSEPTNHFSTTFNLPADAENPSLSLDILADGAVEVVLNGHSLGSSEDPTDTSTNWENPPTAISTSDESFFNIGGDNSLHFIVSNEDDPMGMDYSGTVTYEEPPIIITSAPLPSLVSNGQYQSISYNSAVTSAIDRPDQHNSALAHYQGQQQAQITPVHVLPGYSGVQHPVGSFGSGDIRYAAWEDGSGDIKFSVSQDKGQHWSEPINLSDNSPTAKSPRIASSGDNVYITWEGTSGDKDIYFTKSTDAGKHFNGGTDSDPTGDPRNISKTSGASTDHEIALDGSNFYLVWEDKTTGNGDVYFARSTNGGQDFAATKKIESTNHATFEPDIEAKTISGNKVVDIVWSDESGLSTKHKEAMFAQSTNGGSSFVAKDVSNTKGESVKVLVSITSSNERYVAWLDTEPVKNAPTTNYRIWATKSTDGQTFNTPQLYSEKEGKTLAAFVFDLADKVCAWDIHCSRCQGDDYDKESYSGNGNDQDSAYAKWPWMSWLYHSVWP